MFVYIVVVVVVVVLFYYYLFYLLYCRLSTFRFLTLITLKLLLSIDVYYERILIELLVKDLNKHATTQDYAIMQSRNKISKRDVRIKH